MKDPLPMTKSADGTWSVTVPGLAPQYYSYTFNVDGTDVLDPHNVTLKPSFFSVQNVFLVPGQPPMPWEPADVPHGVVHHHYYHSNIVGINSEYYVYTPPSFDPASKQKISGAVPASRIQRRSQRVDGHGKSQCDSRQPDRAGEGQADDRGDAARLRNHGSDYPGMEHLE